MIDNNNKMKNKKNFRTHTHNRRLHHRRCEKNCSFAGKQGHNAGGWEKIEYVQEPSVIGEAEMA